MIRILGTIGAALLACVLWLDAGPVEADRSTIAGNGGTLTLDWRATRDEKGRPFIEGHVTTYGSKAGYCRTRLLVETLDAQGQVIARNVGFIPGYVGGYDDVYFVEPVRAAGPGYRVSIGSWDKCGGGA